ncbi:MAG: hypothetical protein F6K40_23965 [Okeania sp. SIO3I5]|uniref:hypothetical protein n=1 Tax=Okeania sp. SIO3I5 TaxID=2607805 RepID=UPI0013B9E9A4|nr:hypothetical protein [Okeania sp. SIO3I5]NEQ39142.1 hypothetical protein [Okeania sp. SIO3I5]
MEHLIELLRGIAIEGLEISSIAGVTWWASQISNKVDSLPDREDVDQLQIKVRDMETFLKKENGYSPVDLDF